MITRYNRGVGDGLLWQFSMIRSHIKPAKLAIKTTINRNSILVGNGSFCFRICSTGKPCSISVSISAKEFPFPFRKIPFLFSYFHSISIFLQKSRKVFAPLSSLFQSTTANQRTCIWYRCRDVRKYIQLYLMYQEMLQQYLLLACFMQQQKRVDKQRSSYMYHCIFWIFKTCTSNF
jgi:hypothetical protein